MTITTIFGINLVPLCFAIAEVEDKTMMRGIYAAVYHDGPVKEEDHVV